LDYPQNDPNDNMLKEALYYIEYEICLEGNWAPLGVKNRFDIILIQKRIKAKDVYQPSKRVISTPLYTLHRTL
jgi:hypothetical protein